MSSPRHERRRGSDRNKRNSFDHEVDATSWTPKRERDRVSGITSLHVAEAQVAKSQLRRAVAETEEEEEREERKERKDITG